MPPWLSPVERLAVNQSVIGSNPIGGANSDFISKSEANLGFKSIANFSPKMGITSQMKYYKNSQSFAK